MNEYIATIVAAILVGVIGIAGFNSMEQHLDNNQVACSEYKEVQKTVFINNVPRIINSKECVD
jgi:predicted negative regulator of RcsB-dependent stress response